MYVEWNLLHTIEADRRSTGYQANTTATPNDRTSNGHSYDSVDRNFQLDFTISPIDSDLDPDSTMDFVALLTARNYAITIHYSADNNNISNFANSVRATASSQIQSNITTRRPANALIEINRPTRE